MSENINNENVELEKNSEIENEEAFVLAVDADDAKAVEVTPEIPETSVDDSDDDLPDNNVISSPKRERSSKQPSATSVGDKVISSSAAERPAKAPKKVAEVKEEKVALHSTKNVTWNGVGKVYRGYNIVSKDAAEKWLTRSHVRLATPEEVAGEFSNN